MNSFYESANYQHFHLTVALDFGQFCPKVFFWDFQPLDELELTVWVPLKFQDATFGAIKFFENFFSPVVPPEVGVGIRCFSSRGVFWKYKAHPNLVRLSELQS